MSSPVPLPPEKCLNGYCRSPVACNAFGYCGERNMITKGLRLIDPRLETEIYGILRDHGSVGIDEIARRLEERRVMRKPGRLRPGSVYTGRPKRREIAFHVLTILMAGQPAPHEHEAP